MECVWPVSHPKHGSGFGGRHLFTIGLGEAMIFRFRSGMFWVHSSQRLLMASDR
jgi:hypothetical protein